MEILIKNLDADSGTIKRLIALLDCENVEFVVQQNNGKPIVSGSLPLAGIKEFDELISQFEKGVITYSEMCCGLWNKGYSAGYKESQKRQ